MFQLASRAIITRRWKESGEREREKEVQLRHTLVCVHRDTAIPRVHFFEMKSNKTTG